MRWKKPREVGRTLADWCLCLVVFVLILVTAPIWLIMLALNEEEPGDDYRLSRWL